jgi:hypothetical protein
VGTGFIVQPHKLRQSISRMLADAGHDAHLTQDFFWATGTFGIRLSTKLNRSGERSGSVIFERSANRYIPGNWVRKGRHNMLAGVVLMAFIRHPMTLPDGQQFFVLEPLADDGHEHKLFARMRPDVFARDGQPMVLAAEVGPGSRIKVDDHGMTMRVIQVMDHKTVNPFAES